MGGRQSTPAEAPKAAANLQDAAANLEQKIEELGSKIQKADEEARQWVAKQSTDPTAKARAMQALKRKKLYEQQRDQLVDTQFNVENLAFQQEQATITASTVEAMKKATDQLKKQTQNIGVNEVDKLTDEMQDISAEMKDIQAALAAPSATGTAAEEEAEAELRAMYEMQTQKEAEEASGRVIESSGALQALPLEAIGGLSGRSSAPDLWFCFEAAAILAGGSVTVTPAAPAVPAAKAAGYAKAASPPRDLSEPRTCGGVSEPDARASDGCPMPQELRHASAGKHGGDTNSLDELRKSEQSAGSMRQQYGRNPAQCMPRAPAAQSRPGRYTQELIARVQEAGLEVQEARTGEAVAALARRQADVGLIISCGSPVVLTEPVDLRAHVCKTTAAMLLFPKAPVVGICYGMQLLALLYGGALREWTEMRRAPGVTSRLLSGMAPRFQQKASNFIFVETLPQHFVATAWDPLDRVMAMEHERDHVYGIQWHPEVISEQVGRKLIDRILGLVGETRSSTMPWEGFCTPSGPEVQCCASCPSEVQAFTLHEVDLELRKVVKALVTGAAAGNADLGKVLAGRRKELMAKIRSSQSGCEGADGQGDLGAACASASEELREVATSWLSNPAPAG
ncbi:unnamed protein product [Effrenium voratum]|uniref:Glutamine amidotransferase domain-containing protein n=1 Tax=Effrenium voratum TaxID=2562239 RepID=A0AA36MPI1_9DINO|nr:unnamed protein product [Effrenium voratum]